MNIEFIKLFELIDKLSQGKTVVYCPNFGNWGDGLIHQGTVRFLNFFHIDYVVLDRFKLAADPSLIPSESKLLLYGGAGSWRTVKGRQTELLPSCALGVENVVVLPASYGANFGSHFEQLEDDVLRIPSGKVHYFARDKHSSIINNPQSRFCHDMALFYGPVEVDQYSGVGNFFRTDNESARKTDIPSDNLDVSTLGHAFSPVGEFFSIIGQYETVRTDRLHVGIAACLLGRRLELFAGSYFKNHDIYKSSLAERYKNVTFIEA